MDETNESMHRMKKIGYKNNLIRNRSTHTKLTCTKCGRITRSTHLIYFKGKYLCYVCRRRLYTSRCQDSAIKIYTELNKRPLR